MYEININGRGFSLIFSQVIIRKDGKIILYCKGADSKIKERLDPSEKKIMAETDEHLNVKIESGNFLLIEFFFRNLQQKVYVHFVQLIKK